MEILLGYKSALHSSEARPLLPAQDQKRIKELLF
jgi:hypothetical protein